MSEPTTSKYMDKDRALKVDCQVKLRLPMKMGDGVEYRPERFGVPIPAGTVLPKTAIVLHELKPTPEQTESKRAEAEANLAAAEAKLAADAKAKEAELVKAAEDAAEAGKKAEAEKKAAEAATAGKPIKL
jgi:hypothetical protein